MDPHQLQKLKAEQRPVCAAPPELGTTVAPGTLQGLRACSKAGAAVLAARRGQGQAAGVAFAGCDPAYFRRNFVSLRACPEETSPCPGSQYQHIPVPTTRMFVNAQQYFLVTV